MFCDHVIVSPCGSSNWVAGTLRGCSHVGGISVYWHDQSSAHSVSFVSFVVFYPCTLRLVQGGGIDPPPRGFRSPVAHRGPAYFFSASAFSSGSQSMVALAPE